MSTEADPDVLEAYAKNLDNLQKAFDRISDYVTTSACDKAGFTGLLTILHPAVDLVDTLFQETIDFGRDRMDSLSEGMQKVAERYRKDEKTNEDIFTRILTEVDEKVDVVP